ncbi:MAG TPA: imidazole glycerol phosphate synthase cyclase subunit [Candidatus Peribacterales bacterium]|nr:imidazole glycerol phosphate synthase cyclase subunit [Candidatus Peribacterales bacterium]
MLKKRIIPSLLLKNGRMVKTVHFTGERDTGYPVTAASVYDGQRVDELIILDIEASGEDRGTLLKIIGDMSEECFMPLCVGGGIRSVEDIRTLLKRGADKVAINTAAVETPHLIEDAAAKFGSSTIVGSIDVKKNALGTYEVFIRGGSIATGLDPVAWSKELERRGAGEIFLTSIDRDGTMEGMDIPLIQNVVKVVSIPVIASGGVGTLAHLHECLTDGGAAAVSAASIFHFTDQSPIKARKYLVDHGVNVRR